MHRSPNFFPPSHKALNKRENQHSEGSCHGGCCWWHSGIMCPMQVSSITSTQNPKLIIYLLTPEVRRNLPTLIPTRWNSLFKQFLGCCGLPQKPRSKGTCLWKGLVSYKLQQLAASHPWVPPACCRKRQLIAVLGRDSGCCFRHSSPQLRRSFCSLSGYSSAAEPRKRKAFGWQGQRKQKAQ